MRLSTPSRANLVLPALSIVAALGLWEIISRTGAIPQQELPAMSTSFRTLWTIVQTRRVLDGAAPDDPRVGARSRHRGRPCRSPSGSSLGSSDLAAAAFRVPIEFLRPIPSAALIPLLVLTLGTNVKSEVFLAAFGAFWPLLVQTMYGVRDVDPLALDTARSFGMGRLERLVRITLPSSVPYIATGLRIASTVSLILAFTAELFLGIPGLGQKMNFAQAYGLNDELYALALAVGFLGLGIHVAFTRIERRALRWHPSQRNAEA